MVEGGVSDVAQCIGCQASRFKEPGNIYVKAIAHVISNDK